MMTYTDCARTSDMTPWTVSLLRAAERDLRRTEHWTVKDGKHYCPKHIAVATSED